MPIIKSGFDEINSSNKEGFTQLFSDIFEHSPWVAKSAWKFRPFTNLYQLHSAMTRALNSACRKDQLTLLKAHPDLATKKQAINKLTKASRAEQTSTGLDQLSAEEYDTFNQLNKHYREKFGFPFIIAVRDHDKQSILERFKTRIKNDAETEFLEALRNVSRIAYYRLIDSVKNEDLTNRLHELTPRVEKDLALTHYPKREWVLPRQTAKSEHVYDVIIVGAGQSGLGIGFGLLRQNINNILIIDKAPQGEETPWTTYARMITLRTPKHITSIDLDIPSLTYQAWFETQFGKSGRLRRQLSKPLRV